jgi:hypothetical protein
MTPKRMLLAAMLLAGLVVVGAVSKEGEGAGERMAAAAGKLADSLNADQKAKALYGFDDKERTNWYFVPHQENKKPLRKGLRMDQMTDEQRKATLELVRAGTSAAGFVKATTIMSLESILADLEKNGANVRDPSWYWMTLFGTPSKTGRWGWRIEGHHLSLNFVVDKGKVAAATPAFFGANPARVMGGDKKGLRTLPEAEDLALELFGSLDEDQKKTALQGKVFPEIEQGKPAPTVGKPVGLPAAKMTPKQRDTLLHLIDGYAARMEPEVAAAEMDEVKRAGLDGVHFAFAQDRDKPGRPWTYRVQGPTFLIEFLDVQPDSAGNPVNHIHSCWRSMNGDFGIPVP